MSILAAQMLTVILLQQSADPQEAAPPPTGWQARDPSTLKNKPRIIETKRDGDEVSLTVFNDGSTPLMYLSGTGGIRTHQETEENGRWELGKWDWCGAGKTMQIIEPGKSVQFVVRFQNADKRERLLGHFREKALVGSGYVVLAVEPAK